ncbi:MAG: AMP-binding protein [bacterium]|nr:AMP-binding protein [bacterium]
MRTIAWRPYGPYLTSRIADFMRHEGITTWQELIERSNNDIEWFWNSALAHLGVEWFEPYTRLYDDSAGMPWTTWFGGGKINITHNCLDRHIAGGKWLDYALWFETDDGFSRGITYGDLYRLVNKLSSAMRRAGVKPGDRIAMRMTISPEAVAVMLAAFKIGASCMQPPARLGDAALTQCLAPGKPVMLCTQDGYVRGGKTFDLSASNRKLIENLPTLKTSIVFPRISSNQNTDYAILWSTFLESGIGGDVQTAWLDAEAEALLLYSSGTTGTPKAIVHTHGGIMAQVPKEVGYAFDCREGDVFYWFTNIGWMMAPWEIIGSLFFGASVVLSEGTHLDPSPHRLFDLIRRFGVTIFGCTPTVLRDLKSCGEDFSMHRNAKLRILGSTGEPIDEETWRWYFETFGKEKCPIMNISGGTEVIGCLVSPLPIMPQKPASLGAAALGMTTEVVDDAGNTVRCGSGNLVCRKPFPSMTRGFLGNNELFLKTYFEKLPGVWFHGDRVEVDADGWWYVRGRADDLIVRGGVKHDPAKIEEAIMVFPGPPKFSAAAAFGARDERVGQRIVVLAVPATGYAANEMTPDIVSAIKRHVKTIYDPMGQPDEIHVVRTLPKNFAAKIPRNMIRKAWEGEDPGDLTRIENADVVAEISALGFSSRIQKAPSD